MKLAENIKTAATCKATTPQGTVSATPKWDKALKSELEEILKAERVELAARREARLGDTAAAHLDKLETDGPLGLALSGGGIRSAATCLGAIQALHAKHKGHDGATTSLARFDYLSTVSGGGYIGATLSAAMSEAGCQTYPFGEHVKDSALVGYLRNASNYLFPRDGSTAANIGAGLAMLLRGFIANAILVAVPLLLLALLVRLAYPDAAALHDTNVLLRMLHGLAVLAGVAVAATAPWGLGVALVISAIAAIIAAQVTLNAAAGALATAPRLSLALRLALTLGVAALIGLALLCQPHGDAAALRLWPAPLLLPLLTAAFLAVLLLIWALAATTKPRQSVTDTGGCLSTNAVRLFFGFVALAALDLQAPAIALMHDWVRGCFSLPGPKEVWAALVVLGGGAVAASGQLEKILAGSKRDPRVRALLTRLGATLALYLIALFLPLMLWLGFLRLCVWLITDGATPAAWQVCLAVLAGAIIVAAFLQPNAYSLNRFYRDRLGRAFLGGLRLHHVTDPRKATKAWETLRLSDLQASKGPYPIITAAINLRGSKKANQRGRNAGFFYFTPFHVGSGLTGYAWLKTKADERDRAKNECLNLDLATVIAISGAAFSANAGSNTIAPLAPSLALLNVRLGYALTNPMTLFGQDKIEDATVTRRLFRFFLWNEMFGKLDECSETVHLTDGGHVENLGIYPLLRRRCRLILAVDAEADRDYGLESLLKLERYARIDMGIRIVLPWEEIAAQAQATKTALLDPATARDSKELRKKGPHIAIGKIFYSPKLPDDEPPCDPNNAHTIDAAKPNAPDSARAAEDDERNQGILVYVKASLTGDEKDYILDYARRYPDFPHETTLDQNFSEEQFEMYRALGFHMVEGLFSGHRLSFDDECFADEDAAREAVNRWLPLPPTPKSRPPIAPAPPAAAAGQDAPQNAAP